MATVDDFVGHLKTGITAALGSATYATDPSSDDVPLASGVTLVQISAIPARVTNKIDSNAAHTIVAVRLRVHHALNWPSETLEAWMLGGAETLATYLTSAASYRAFASVYNVDEIEIDGPGELVVKGLVASFSVEAQITLTP